MKRPSLTLILSGVFLAYIAHSMWTIYGLFCPAPCPPKAQCLTSILTHNPKLKLWVYTSSQSHVDHNSKKSLIWELDDLTISETVEKEVNVSIPKKTRNNGTLFAHVFLTQNSARPFSDRFESYGSSLLTTYMIPQAQAFNLMGDKVGNNETEVPKTLSRDKPVSHWHTKFTVSIMDDLLTFDRMNVPGEIHRFMKINYDGEYMPILYIDRLSSRIRDLTPINETSKEMPLTITYRPISVGKLRLWVNMEESMKTLKGFGFSEKDTDEMKGIFADTNFYLLMLTFIVAAFHLLFDFLAFKNDISYWKKRDTMIGLSSRTVVWRCVSTIIIFLYLMDEETSLLVLIPAGIGAIIEVWKVTKAFKVKVSWNGIKPSFTFGDTSAAEKETQQFDSQAMKYLSYVLYPLCIGGAAYSLIYTPHKSWVSWCIQSLVNGVYAFGFLFMLPQLFVNYKLKSVAHLPWRAFMYKAFNTFIDDVFAFIITMPTAHRLACFRDDIVFMFYLYQRWLYPVDKTRVNEYGQSFDSTEKEDGETKKTK